MKQKSSQPKNFPVALPRVISKTVASSLFLCLVFLLSTNGSLFAKKTLPTCGMTVSAAASPVPACVGNTLTLTATVSGGTAPYTYRWDDAPFPADFSATVSTATTTTPPMTGMDGGLYNVTVTDAAGCTAHNSVNVPVYSNPVISSTLATPNPVCTGNVLSLTNGYSTGGSGINSYSWTGPNSYTSTDANPNLSGITSAAAGVYSVTITDNHGCTTSGATYTVSVMTNTVNVTSTGAVSLCVGSSATLTASGGSTYDWNPATGLSPATGSVVTANPTSSITYTVTGHVGNCYNSTTLPVTVLPMYAVTASAGSNGSISSSGTTNVCSGANMTYTVTPSPGYHTLDIQVDGSSIGTTSPFTLYGVVATHTVTATFAPNCTAPSITACPGSVSQNADAGVCNAVVTYTGATVTGTSPSITYSQNSGTAFSVGVTTVNVSATNSCGSDNCSFTVTVTDNQAPTITAPANVTVSADAGSCAAASVALGSPTVSDNCGISSTTNNAPSSFPVGTTVVTWTTSDAKGNTATATQTVNVTPNTLSVSATETDATCYGGSTGTITTTVTGGTGSYNYSWTGGASGDSPTGLSAGTYSVTVTDAGCSAEAAATTSVTVSQPPVLTASAVAGIIACNGGTTTVAVTGSGGTGTISGVGTFTVTAGTYTYTVTDAHTCPASASVTITDPALLTASASAGTIACNGGTTTMTVSGSGGTGMLSGVGTFTVTAGSYPNTVTDASGCTATAPVVITEPALLTVSASPGTISCHGGTTSVTVTASGGTGVLSGTGIFTVGGGSHTYTVTDDNTCSASASVTIADPALLTASATAGTIACNGGTTTVTVTGSGGTGTLTGTGSYTVGAGTYSYSITDAHSCPASASVTVGEPAALSLAGAVSVNVNCYGASTGSVTSNVTGGTAPYTYSWSNGSTSANLTGLAAGTYSVTVTDAHGCTVSGSYTLTQPSAALAVEATITPATSCTNGTITTSVTGGTTAYNYSWSSGATTANLTAPAGTYSVVVTDAHGCTVSGGPYVITSTSTSPLFSASSTIVNVSCNGGSNGSIVDSIAGGTMPYSYSWAPSGVGVPSGRTLGSAPAGTYTITVTDEGGCSTKVTFTITQPAVLAVSATTSNVTCHGAANGSITTTVTGGTAPYTYSWSTGATTANLTGRPGGTYSVTVTDAHGCTASGSSTISEPAVLALSATTANVTCNGGTNGSVTTTVTGGTTAYTYSWSNGSTGANLSAVTAGTYSVTVTDAHSCTTTGSYTLTQPTAINITDGVGNVSCHGGSNGSITITVTGGTPGYTYLWSNGTTAMNPTGLTAGTYSVTATDAHGCTNVAFFTVTQPAALANAATVVNVSCYGGSNGSVTSAVSGGTTPYTYSWSTGVTTANITSRAAGTYSVTVTDAHACTLASSYTITQPPVLTGTVTASPMYPVPTYGRPYTIYMVYGAQTVTMTETASGGTPGYTYSWAPVSGTTSTMADAILPTDIGLLTRTYTVTVTDSKGCTVSDTQTIYVYDIRCHGDGLGHDHTTPHGCIYLCSPSGHTTNVDSADVASYLALGYSLDRCHGAHRDAAPGADGTPTGSADIKVYPNPTTGIFDLEIPTAYKTAVVQVSDVTGRVIETREITDSQGGPVQFSLSNFGQGMYFVRVKAGDEVFVGKLLKN